MKTFDVILWAVDDCTLNERKLLNKKTKLCQTKTETFFLVGMVSVGNDDIYYGEQMKIP